MRIAALFCLALFLNGCATVSDIRSLPPARTMKSNLPAKQIVDCLMFRAPAEVKGALVYYYQFNLSENPKDYFHILVALSDQPMAEAGFRTLETGETQIDLNSRWNFWGEDSFWACIQQCASPQNSPGK